MIEKAAAILIVSIAMWVLAIAWRIAKGDL